MLATIKFAFCTVFAKPVRLFISFILIVVTLCLTAVLILFNTFQFLDFEKRLYFSESNPFYASEYLNYAYRDSMDVGPLQHNEHFSTSAVEELTTELDSYGYGYAITQIDRQAQFVLEGNTYSRIGAGTVLGAYHLDSFFGCYTSAMNSASYDVSSVNRLFDDDGNIAPFFPSYTTTGVSYMTFYKGTTCFVDGMEKSALDTFGYSVYGRLPEKADEVVIPQSIYNAFAAYGYCDAGDIEQEDNVRGEVEEINSYDDIIGKTIKLGTGKATRSACIDATIVGVLEVDYEEHNWRYYIGYPSEERLMSEIEEGYVECSRTYPLFFDIIVSQDYFDRYAEADAYADFVTVSKDVGQETLEDYVDIAFRWQEGKTYREIDALDGVSYWRISFCYMQGNSIMSLLSLLYLFLFTIEPFIPFVYVALPFCFLLAGFLLYSSIENRRRQTGILRSLGAGGKQITLSLFLALAAFCLICAVAAMVLTGGFIVWLNNYFSDFVLSLKPFRLTWIVVLFLFGYPLLIAAAVAGLYFVRERSTTIISQLSPVAKKAGRKRN